MEIITIIEYNQHESKQQFTILIIASLEFFIDVLL